MKKHTTNFYTTWTSKDGVTHKISEMSTEHIINCMKLITMSLFPTIYKEKTKLLKYDFVVTHGKSYNKAFYSELTKRRKECEAMRR